MFSPGSPAGAGVALSGAAGGSPSADAIVNAMQRDARGMRLAQSFGWPTQHGSGAGASVGTPYVAGMTAGAAVAGGADMYPQYQPSPPPSTPPPARTEGKAPTPESTAADLRRLNIEAQSLEMWQSRLREWVAEEVLAPLAQRLRVADLRWRLCAEEAAKVAGDARLSGAAAAVSGGARPDLARASEDNARARALWDELTRVGMALDAAVLNDEKQKAQASAAPSPPGLFGNTLFGGGGGAAAFGPSAAAQRQVAARAHAKAVVAEARRALLERRALAAFVRGDWPRGLLPASATVVYVTARYEALARGHCAAAFNADGGAEVAGGGGLDSAALRWNAEQPTDSALVLHAVAGWAASRGWEFPLGDAFEAAQGAGSAAGSALGGALGGGALGGAGGPQSGVAGLPPQIMAELAAVVWARFAPHPVGGSGAFYAGTLPNALQAQSKPTERYTALLAKAPPRGHDATALVAHRLGDARKAYYEVRAEKVGTVITLGGRGAVWHALALFVRFVVAADPVDGGLGALSLKTTGVARIFE